MTLNSSRSYWLKASRSDMHGIARGYIHNRAVACYSHMRFNLLTHESGCFELHKMVLSECFTYFRVFRCFVSSIV